MRDAISGNKRYDTATLIVSQVDGVPWSDEKQATGIEVALRRLFAEGVMETILIVDVDPARADLICKLMHDHSVPATRCHDIVETRRAIEPENSPAVIVMHCALIENSFTEVARLRKHPHVQLVFYCTDQGQKSPGLVTKLPEDLAEILLRITEKKRLLLKAS